MIAYRFSALPSVLQLLLTCSYIDIASCTNIPCSFQVLVCRNYRGDVDMSEIEHFMTLLMDKEEEGTLSPILAHGGVRFMWIKHNNLYCILASNLSTLGIKFFYAAFSNLVTKILNTHHLSGCNIQEKC